MPNFDLHEVENPSDGVYHCPPFLRFAYCDSIIHVAPGDENDNIHFAAAMADHEMSSRVARHVGLDVEAILGEKQRSVTRETVWGSNKATIHGEAGSVSL